MKFHSLALCLPLIICLGCGTSTDGRASGGGGGSGGGGSGGNDGDAGHSGANSAGANSAGANSAGANSAGANSAGMDAGPEACFRGLQAAPGQVLEIQRFRTADATTKLWRARETTPEATVGETFAFKLVRFWVDGELDADTCVREASLLDYDYAHHNWSENWVATTSQAVYAGHEQFHNSMGSELQWIDTLVISTPSGDPISSDLRLIDDGCVSMPLDYNVCRLRQRLDTSE